MSLIQTTERRLLTLNSGSSSLKFAVFTVGNPPRRILSGNITGLDRQPSMKIRSREGREIACENIAARDHGAGLDVAWQWLEEHGELRDLTAAGHRIVHGGPTFGEPRRVTAAVLAELHRLVPFAPDHLPSEIALIEALQARRAELPQILCFDTAFHATLPRVARVLPLPRRFERTGVRRYGFHGLSYQFLLEELRRLDPRVAEGRVIFAHLGNGASLAAVQAGRCIDTSMAFTPASGVPMSTRSGDLDPGLMAHVARAEKMTPARFHRLVNFEAGLLGLSETTSDVSELVKRSRADARAAEAVAVFCYHVKKWIGAYAAALGGVDAIVFSGGVGEHVPEIRERICHGLAFLGVEIDAAANSASAAVISSAGSRVNVRVIPTNEEQVIAEAVCREIAGLALAGPTRHAAP
jgi:acetate kinase